MNLWINVVFYQATWLGAIAGAARGWWWAGPTIFAVFAAWQLAVSRLRVADLELMLCAAVVSGVTGQLVAGAWDVVSNGGNGRSDEVVETAGVDAAGVDATGVDEASPGPGEERRGLAPRRAAG